MNKDFYISLISKKLSNELNAAELKDLNIWLSDDKANSLTLNQFKSTWDLTTDYKSDFSFDAGTAFQSFASKYEIPTTHTKTNIEPKRKVGVKKYIFILALLMITSAFIGALIYNSYFNSDNPNQVANHEMYAQSFNLNDAVNVTIAPNSRFEKGVYTIERKDVSGNSSSNTINSSNNNKNGNSKNSNSTIGNGNNGNGNNGDSTNGNSINWNSTYGDSEYVNRTDGIRTNKQESYSSYSKDLSNNSKNNSSDYNINDRNSSSNKLGSSRLTNDNNRSNSNTDNRRGIGTVINDDSQNSKHGSDGKNYTVENFYGQGYFDVNVKSGMKPAIIAVEEGNYIETENAIFNLQNYEDDNFSIIDVQTGSVKFVAGDNVLIVEEGQRLIYDETTKNFEKVSLPKLSPFQWHKGILVFDNTPLDEAFSMMERFFGVDIEVTDDSDLSNQNFTATYYKSSTLNDCLEILSESIDMDIVRNGQRNIEVSNIK